MFFSSWKNSKVFQKQKFTADEKNIIKIPIPIFSIDSYIIQPAAININIASINPERFSILSYPNLSSLSNGFDDVSTLIYAIVLASKSIDECMAWDITYIEPIIIPQTNFDKVRNKLEDTDNIALFVFHPYPTLLLFKEKGDNIFILFALYCLCWAILCSSFA